MRKTGFNGRVLVVGGGGFGTIAAIRALEAGVEVLVIDSDPRCEASSLLECKEGIALKMADWRTSFRETFESYAPSWTVPAVPGHMLGMVALDELVMRHGGVCFASFGELDRLAPHVVHQDPSVGLLVTSYMHGGRCLTDCGQPEVCPVTGEDRPVPMNVLMDALLEARGHRHDVLVCTDLGGVGAIGYDGLRSFFENLGRVGRGEVYGVATSCRCHAVANLLYIP